MKIPQINAHEMRGKIAEFARTPRARKLGWWTVGVIAAIGVFGALVAPPLVRTELEQRLTEVLHRKVGIDALSINPYALSATVHGLRLAERDSDTAALTVTELYARVSVSSLFHLAPVLSAIRITGPGVQITRLEANRYNWSDLIDEFLDKPRDPNEPPARFSLANVEIVGGDITFDDRPEKVKHVLSDIQLGVPFLSSLPVNQDISIEPKFSARLNGTPIELVASAKPFKDSRDSTLKLEVKGLDLTRYVEYVPGKLPVMLRSAKLYTDLELTFAQPKDRTPTVVLSGKASLADLDIREPAGAPIFKAGRLAVELRAVEPLMRRFDIAKVAIESPEIKISRRKNGDIYPLALLIPARPAKSPAKPAAPAPALVYEFGEILLSAGKVEMLDERGGRAIRSTFDDLQVSVKGISGKPGATGQFEVNEHSTTGDVLAVAGTFGLQPVQAAGTVRIEQLQLARLWPYARTFIAADAAGGQLDLSASFAFADNRGAPNITVKDADAAIRSLVLKQLWDKQEILRVPTFAVHGAEFDLLAHTATVGELNASDGRVSVRRDRDGVVNLQKILTARVAEVSPAPPPAATTAGIPAQAWIATLQKLAVAHYAVSVEDEGAGPAATAHIENLNLTAENLSNAKGERGNMALRLTLNKTGTLAVSGPVSISPISARLKIDARKFGIVPAQPYFERFVNAIVSSGDITAKGNAVFDVPDGGAPRAGFKGDVTLADFAAVTKAGNEELLRWKSFHLGGVNAMTVPLKVVIAEIALSDFYARVVVTPAGRINLQDLMAGAEAPGSAEVDAAAALAVNAAPIAAAGPAPDVQIGKITLAGGNVNFSDFFIKPNYSANLTGLGGGVTAISRDLAGDVDLRAKIDNTAPVEITGRINPLAKDVLLDIKASAHDIELAPLTPYSAKYVGYGIEKGKLSMDVAYQIENRKLSAQNRVILNQLTFGEKVESPTALKLPVLFAVSLLKDRNGVIDVNLPIGGSIDDPKFSVGAIIWQVIGNLLMKAVTAPFALIGSLFGGGEELAYLEFAPGSAALSPAADAKLGSLSKALAERPALKLDIAGRVDVEADREGLKKSSLERKVKAQKLKDTVKGGAAAGALDQVTVEPGEYPKYLAKAYGEEKFSKPRNVIGLAKTLLVPEMEQLMITNTQVTEEDLRQLANQRGQAVKDYLIETGKVPEERVFLLAPRVNADGVKDNGNLARVDFSLK
jgi:hypothetical protein